MRRVAVSFLKAARAPSRPFASSAGEVGPSGGLDSAAKAMQLGVGVVTVVAAIAAGGYALHTVDAKLLAMDARLSGKVETIDAKMAGVKETVTKEVDAKLAGVKETVTKEVDAKLAGAQREVDAKLAGAANKTARW